MTTKKLILPEMTINRESIEVNDNFQRLLRHCEPVLEVDKINSPILKVKYPPNAYGNYQCLYQHHVEDLKSNEKFKTQVVVFFSIRHLMNKTKSSAISDTTLLFDDTIGHGLFGLEDIEKQDFVAVLNVLRYCDNVQAFFKLKVVVMPIFDNNNHFMVIAFSPLLYTETTNSSLFFLDSHVPTHFGLIDQMLKRINAFLDFLFSISNDVDRQTSKADIKSKRQLYGSNEDNVCANTLSFIDVSKYIPDKERQSVPENTGISSSTYRDYNCALYAGVYAHTLSVTSGELYKALELSKTHSLDVALPNYFKIPEWNTGIGINMSAFREELRTTLVEEAVQSRKVVDLICNDTTIIQESKKTKYVDTSSPRRESVETTIATPYQQDLSTSSPTTPDLNCGQKRKDLKLSSTSGYGSASPSQDDMSTPSTTTPELSSQKQKRSQMQKGTILMTNLPDPQKKQTTMKSFYLNTNK